MIELFIFFWQTSWKLADRKSLCFPPSDLEIKPSTSQVELRSLGNTWFPLRSLLVVRKLVVVSVKEPSGYNIDSRLQCNGLHTAPCTVYIGKIRIR